MRINIIEIISTAVKIVDLCLRFGVAGIARLRGLGFFGTIGGLPFREGR